MNIRCTFARHVKRWAEPHKTTSSGPFGFGLINIAGQYGLCIRCGREFERAWVTSASDDFSSDAKHLPFHWTAYFPDFGKDISREEDLKGIAR